MKRNIVVVVLLILSGCASSSEGLKRATASAVPGISPDQVSISEVHRGLTNVSWQADTPKGHYKCSANDMARRVDCVK